VFLSLVAGCGDEGIKDVESVLLGVRTAERCFVMVLRETEFANIHSKAGCKLYHIFFLL